MRFFPKQIMLLLTLLLPISSWAGLATVVVETRLSNSDMTADIKYKADNSKCINFTNPSQLNLSSKEIKSFKIDSDQSGKCGSAKEGTERYAVYLLTVKDKNNEIFYNGEFKCTQGNDGFWQKCTFGSNPTTKIDVVSEVRNPGAHVGYVSILITNRFGKTLEKNK